MQALPEDLVGNILSLAGREAGPSIALVCRQWHRVLYEQPALWDKLAIDVPPAAKLTVEQAAAWLAGKEALLRRVAPLLAALAVGGEPLSSLAAKAGRSSNSGVEALLAALPLAAVERLSITQRRGGGTSPQEPSTVFTPATAEAIAALPRLCDLTVGYSRATGHAVKALTALTCLTHLTLHSTGPVPGVHHLTSLSGLQELELCDGRAGAAAEHSVPLLPAAAFPALRRLAQAAYTLRTPAGVDFEGFAPPNLRCQACVQLRRSPADSTAWLLTVGRVALTAAAPLGALVAALGVDPARVARLLLDQCVFHSGGASLAACDAPALPGLTRLLLSRTGGGGAAVQELLGALPALRVANLTALQLPGGLPAALCRHRGLHTLQASDCGLAALPPGPYLQGLTTLALDGNHLPTLPPSLAAAGRLRQLSLQRNPLRLTSADVDGILCCMPALQELEASEGQLPPQAAAHLAARLPRLSVWQAGAGSTRRLLCRPA